MPKNKDQPIRTNPGGAPPLLIYVSSNGKNRPLRVDGKFSSKMVGDFTHVEWTYVMSEQITLTFTLSRSETPFTNRIISRGLACGYFSLQQLRKILSIREIQKVRAPEFVSYSEDADTRTLVFKLDRTQRT